MKTRDKPLHVLCRGWIDAAFGARLLGRLHQEASACVVQSRAGEFELMFSTRTRPQGPPLAARCLRERACCYTAIIPPATCSQARTTCAISTLCPQARS